MTTRAPRCPKCTSSMEEGFVLSERHGMPAVTTWAAGAPVKGWFGVKAPRKPLEIRTWRCQRCGLLESYALA